jgi:hypothetical protein
LFTVFLLPFSPMAARVRLSLRPFSF